MAFKGKYLIKFKFLNMKIIFKFLALGFLCFCSLGCMPEKPDPWIAINQRLDERIRLENERFSKSVEILSAPAGARIEVNGEYVGESPCTVEVVSDRHGKLAEKFHVTALPRQPGHSVQFKWFYSGDKVPARVFFDMSLSRYRPSIDVNIID